MFKNTVPQSPEKKYSTGGGPNIAYDPSDYHCGIDDSPPVDTNKLWKDEPNCFDYEGMMVVRSTSSCQSKHQCPFWLI